jgi:tight adherence protein C
VVLILILAVLLFGLAVALFASAVLAPRMRRSENLAGIEAYGYITRHEAPTAPRRRNRSLDQLATSLGDLVARRVISFREDEVQRELISAGFFRVSARRFLGYRALLAIALPLFVVWLLSLAGASVVVVIFAGVAAFFLGWVAPNFVVHRRAKQRLHHVDLALPAMIDLLVVMLEAGVAFSAAMRMAAERISGPLGDELKLTIQEQSLGLSMLESLENWLRRCETPAVRSFVRAMVQGDRLGVSIGTILRNQAIEMRSRQKSFVEERAQKAPIKMLFPLVFLIFPAMFVVILAPAIITIYKTLRTV